MTPSKWGKPLPQEGISIEYQIVVPPPKALAQIMASFANTQGGTILLGITVERTEPIVIGLPEDLDVSVFIESACSYLRPQPTVHHYADQIDGKNIYVIEVQKYDTPVLSGDDVYYDRTSATIKRVGETGKAGYSALNQLFHKLKQSELHASSSKLDLTKHYSALFSLIDRCSTILFPVSPSLPTQIPEGKILLRLAFSSLIDPFEIYLRDLILAIYLADPDTLKSKSPVLVEDVLSHKSMAEFIEFEANRRVDKLSRGEIGTFIDKLKKEQKLELFPGSELIRAKELFEIRHLYIHQNGRVDAAFLKKCPTQTLQIGQEHTICADDFCTTAAFLLNAVNKLDNDAVLKYHLTTFKRGI